MRFGNFVGVDAIIDPLVMRFGYSVGLAALSQPLFVGVDAIIDPFE